MRLLYVPVVCMCLCLFIYCRLFLDPEVTSLKNPAHYLYQEGYIFIDVSYLVSYFCLLAGLHRNYSTDFHNIR